MAKKKVSLLEFVQGFIESLKNNKAKEIVKKSNERLEKFKEYSDKKNK